MHLSESNTRSKDGEHLAENVPNFQESRILNPGMDHVEENIEIHSASTHLEDSSINEGESRFKVTETSEITPQEDISPRQGNEFPKAPHTSVASDNGSSNSRTPFEDNFDMKSPEVKPDLEQLEAVKITPILEQADAVPQENEMQSIPPQHFNTKDTPEVAVILCIKV